MGSQEMSNPSQWRHLVCVLSMKLLFVKKVAVLDEEKW